MEELHEYPQSNFKVFFYLLFDVKYKISDICGL